uniref:Uncharacterized protein n=1 Tax=Pristionchus pacificus TaxID=54126 RepID=A0A2A6BWQ8_PRIPA|eukprot:PDM70276.1 hypothetical protein PRIPAC_46522 [Pristionchus pacificus]
MLRRREFKVGPDETEGRWTIPSHCVPADQLSHLRLHRSDPYLEWRRCWD